MQKTSFTSINLHSGLRTLAILLATIYLAVVIYVIASRIDYRYHLEWMEGVSLGQVYRIMNGQSIYVPASPAFVSTIYPPLYFFLAALVAAFTGIGFLPLRPISVASTLGCMIIIYRMVKNKTNSEWIGFVSVGLFAATFRAGGAWFDIGRVDMLFVFLSLCGIYLSGIATNWNAIAAGAFFALSFLTKQTVTAILAATFLSMLISSPKQALQFLVSFGVLSAVAYFIINRLTNGWYEFYIFVLPAANRITWSAVPTLLARGFGIEALMLVVSCLPFLLNPRKVLQDRLHRHYYLAIGGMIAASAMGLIYPGAYDNAAIPAYAGLSILAGLGVSWLSLSPVQSELKAAPGNILVPYHNYLALFAGKKMYFNIIAYDQFAGQYSHKSLQQLNRFKEELNSTPFAVIVMDNNRGPFEKTTCVDVSQIQYPSNSTFVPVTGRPIQPMTLYTQIP